MLGRTGPPDGYVEPKEFGSTTVLTVSCALARGEGGFLEVWGHQDLLSVPDGSEGISENVATSGKPSDGVNRRSAASERVGESVTAKVRRDDNEDPEWE